MGDRGGRDEMPSTSGTDDDDDEVGGGGRRSGGGEEEGLELKFADRCRLVLSKQPCPALSYKPGELTRC